MAFSALEGKWLVLYRFPRVEREGQSVFSVKADGSVVYEGFVVRGSTDIVLRECSGATVNQLCRDDSGRTCWKNYVLSRGLDADSIEWVRKDDRRCKEMWQRFHGWKDFVITLAVLPEEADNITVTCTSLVGKRLASCLVSKHTTWLDVRLSMAKQLSAYLTRRLKFALLSGALLTTADDARRMADIFELDTDSPMSSEWSEGEESESPVDDPPMTVRHDYNPSGEDRAQIALKQGDLMKIFEVPDSGWAAGVRLDKNTLQEVGEPGWFPYRYLNGANDKSKK